MGAIKDISCASCGAKWQCRTGCGILHGTLSAVKAAFPDEIRQRLDSYEAEAEFSLFDFGYQLAVCERCGAVESVPVIRLLDKQEEYVGVCEKCGGQAKLIDDIRETQCPVCHDCTLSEEETGLWD